jgi:hypothetical protein
MFSLDNGPGPRGRATFVIAGVFGFWREFDLISGGANGVKKIEKIIGDWGWQPVEQRI